MKKLLIRVETVVGDVDFYAPVEEIVKTYSSDFVLVDIVSFCKKYYPEYFPCDLNIILGFFDTTEVI